MMKKILLLIMIVVAMSYQTKAGGMVIGSEKIIPIEEHHYSPHSRQEKPIVLTKPNVSSESIRLVPFEAFLESKERASIVLSSEEYQAPEISKNISTKIADVKPVITQPEHRETVAKFIKASEIYISYDSDKKTLLSSSAKESLKEIAMKSQEDDAVIGIISYAAGEPSMARRVALLRANIIKNTLKSYGVHESKIDVQSFGNQININQSRAFLVN